MKCNNCNVEISTGAKFCPECGTKLENQTKTCLNANCGRTDLPQEAKFCPDCGTKFMINSCKQNEYIGNTGTFKDERDGQEYKWIQIGTQIWMAENLAFKARLGISVFNKRYDEYFGLKYTWEDAFKACPPGWHLPTREEWGLLLKNLIDSGFNYDGTRVGNKVAKSMASKEGWKSTKGFLGFNLSLGSVGRNLDENNKSGFSGLPGGDCDKYGLSFVQMNEIGAWWSSSNYDVDQAFYFAIGFDKAYLTVGHHYIKERGFSVRCVKD